MKVEVEARYLSVDKDAIRKKLVTTGFKLEIPEYTMVRKAFDFSRIGNGLTKWGRVRQEANKTTMTIKEIRGEGINDMYEVELVVDDFDTACKFFEACNIPEKAYQETKREVWVKSGVEVSIDTWPGLDPFLEIEAETEHLVRQISKELGFNFENAEFQGIDKVYEKMLGIPAETICKLPEITFKNPPKASS